ncbi:MAG: hypothetical protein Q4P05_06235 [Actinomycetaceae bacterium]|nr:hypothetical protein [Actinomycetaceae bacterium]
MNNRRVLLKFVAVLAAGASLTACADELPSLPQEGTQPSASAIPNLDGNQIQAVLDDLNTVLAQGDEALDSEILAARVKDPAIAMRSGFYQLAESADESIPALNADPNSVTVTRSDSWPRAIVTVTQTGEEELPSVMFITQSDARAQYKLENWARLFPGESIQTIAISDGTPVVGLESTDYLLTPQEALEAWIDRLNGGEEHADEFEEDDFTSYYQSERSSISEAVEAAGTVTMEAYTADYPVTAVKLADESALVATAFEYQMKYERTVDRATLKVGGTPAKLMEDPEVTDEPVVVKYLCSVLLSLPPKGSEEGITAIGAERVLQSVERVSSE